MVTRVPHCSHWGAHTLLVENNSIIGIEPFEKDTHPSELLQAMKAWLDPKYRIQQPMVREGWLEKRERSDRSGRGKENFIPVSWPQAFDLVASEIARVRDNFGTDSVFAGSYGWASSGRFHHASSQLHRLLNAAGGYTAHRDTYSLAAGPVIIRHVLGDESAVYGGANSYENFVENAEILVVFGALSPRTSQIDSGGIDIHRLEGYLKRIAERKIRVILISPTRSDLPDDVPAEWWPVRPNSDTALMLAMAHEIIRAGRHDSEFLNRYCSGSEEYQAYLAGNEDGVEKDADWAAELTDIPADRIRELALSMSKHRSMITVSWSLQRAEFGEQPYWAGLGLACVLGQIGLPGGGIGYGYASTGALSVNALRGRAVALDQLKGKKQSFIPVARIADALLNPGGSYSYDGEERYYPDLRLIYWAGGNPYHHHQDLHRLERAWQMPETIIVQDPVWTPTARRADIVLPATSTLERNDIAGTSRMRYMFAMRQAVSPLGDSLSDYDICKGVAERLGVSELFTEGRDEMDWLRYMYNESREQIYKQSAEYIAEFDDFWQKGFAELPSTSNWTFLADYRRDPEAYPLNTETGRIMLSSKKLRELGYPDCPPHPAWLAPSEWLGSEQVKSGALHMLSQQPRSRLHSQLDYSHVSATSKTHGHEWIMLNAKDAETRNISEGTKVLVSNSRGKCIAIAKIRQDIRPGVCILPTGAWFMPEKNRAGEVIDRSGNPNVLTFDRGSSQFSQGCSAQSCLVFVSELNSENE